MVTDDGVLDDHAAQLADDSDGALDGVALDLGVTDAHFSLLVDADGGDGERAGLHEVVEAEHAVSCMHLASFCVDDHVLNLREHHSVDVLMVQLLYFLLVVFEDVEDVLVLDQFLLQLGGQVAIVADLDALQMTFAVGMGQVDMDANAMLHQQNDSDLLGVLAHGLGFDDEGFPG